MTTDLIEKLKDNIDIDLVSKFALCNSNRAVSITVLYLVVKHYEIPIIIIILQQKINIFQMKVNNL